MLKSTLPLPKNVGFYIPKCPLLELNKTLCLQCSELWIQCLFIWLNQKQKWKKHSASRHSRALICAMFLLFYGTIVYKVEKQFSPPPTHKVVFLRVRGLSGRVWDQDGETTMVHTESQIISYSSKLYGAESSYFVFLFNHWKFHEWKGTLYRTPLHYANGPSLHQLDEWFGFLLHSFSLLYNC